MKQYILWYVCWQNNRTARSQRLLRGIWAVLLVLLGAYPVAANASADMQEANRLFHQGSPVEALAVYQKAAQQPQFAREALLNRALIYKNLRQYAGAIEMYQHLLAQEAQPAVLAKLGEVYYLNNQPQEALEILRQAAQQGYAAQGMVYFWAGAAEEQRGDPPAARAYYEQAVALNPGLVLAQYRLGTDAWERKQWHQAIRYLETVRDLDPSITRVYPLLARAYYYEKKYEEALRAFRKVAEVFPEDKETDLFIERIYAQAGEKFREDLAQRQRERLAASRPRQAKAVVADQAPQVRVFLTSAPRVRFKSSAAFSLRSLASAAEYRGRSDMLYEISYAKGTLIVRDEQARQVISAAGILIIPQQPDATVLLFDVSIGAGQYWASRTDRMYRGSLEIVAERGGCKIINIVNMEEYLSGVVPSEMPPAWPLEALKAQSVAARSEAFMKLGRHAQDGYDYCADVHCQAYGGANAESSSTSRAVDETRGKIMTYQGRPIDAVYSNSCGGHTQNNIWSDRTDIPYLQGKPCAVSGLEAAFPLTPVTLEEWLWDWSLPAACNNPSFSRSSNFRWMREYTQPYLESLIGRRLDIGRLFAVNILERDRSGHVHSIEVVGSQGRFTVEKELTIRRLLGDLRSGMFNLNVKLDTHGHAERFIFYGGGWGHGVGMCQVGAATMAGQGYTHEKILNYYYTDITIEKKY